jgi:hypothetical protein
MSSVVPEVQPLWNCRTDGASVSQQQHSESGKGRKDERRRKEVGAAGGQASTEGAVDGKERAIKNDKGGYLIMLLLKAIIENHMFLTNYQFSLQPSL